VAKGDISAARDVARYGVALKFCKTCIAMKFVYDDDDDNGRPGGHGDHHFVKAFHVEYFWGFDIGEWRQARSMSQQCIKGNFGDCWNRMF